LEGSLFAILNNQTGFGDKFVSIIVTRIFWYWGFEVRCELVEETIRVEILTETWSTNDGVEGKHRTRGNGGWRWCCGLDNGKWQKISAPTMAHDRKTLTFQDALTVSECTLYRFVGGS